MLDEANKQASWRQKDVKINRENNVHACCIHFRTFLVHNSLKWREKSPQAFILPSRIQMLLRQIVRHRISIKDQARRYSGLYDLWIFLRFQYTC